MVYAGWGGERLILCTALDCFSHPHLPLLWGLKPFLSTLEEWEWSSLGAESL